VPAASTWRRKWAISLAALVLIAVVAAIAGAFNPWLRILLTVEDPLQPADIAIATTDASLEGDLELADLLHAGVVPRVGFLDPAPMRFVREYERRGVALETEQGRLNSLGVPDTAIVPIHATEGGTADATAMIARWCQANRPRVVIIVSAASHSRRVRRELTRALGRSDVRLVMHRPRFDRFLPEVWWRYRPLLRVALPESGKLLLDFVTHPLG